MYIVKKRFLNLSCIMLISKYHTDIYQYLCINKFYELHYVHPAHPAKSTHLLHWQLFAEQPSAA